MRTLLLCAMALSLTAGYTSANQPRGKILNSDGDWCWFNQKTETMSRLHKIEAETGHLVFEDPSCMSAESFNYDINARMIADFVTRKYSHDDANFMSRVEDWRDGSLMQVRGKCVQSATYPIVGVAIEIVADDGAITSAFHTMAAGGCDN